MGSLDVQISEKNDRVTIKIEIDSTAFNRVFDTFDDRTSLIPTLIKVLESPMELMTFIDKRK